MKKLITILAVSGLASAAALWAAEKIQLSDAPFEVQKTVGIQRPDAKVESVETQDKDGQMIYKVEFKDSKANPTLWVAKDGSIVKEKEKGVLGLFETKKLALNELPAATQATVKAETGDNAISSIKEKSKDGKIAYQVEFKQAEKEEKILVAQDGALLEDSRKGAKIAESAGAKTAHPNRMALTDLPKPVQDTINKQSQNANLPLKGISIKQDMKDGQNIYRVEFQEKGPNTKLWIKEDGSILKQEK